MTTERDPRKDPRSGDVFRYADGREVEIRLPLLGGVTELPFPRDNGRFAIWSPGNTWLKRVENAEVVKLGGGKGENHDDRTVSAPRPQGLVENA